MPAISRKSNNPFSFFRFNKAYGSFIADLPINSLYPIDLNNLILENITATQYEVDSIIITWSDKIGTVTVDVQYSIDDLTWVDSTSVNSGVQLSIITGLSIGQKYYVRLKNNESTMSSPWSYSISVFMPFITTWVDAEIWDDAEIWVD